MNDLISEQISKLTAYLASGLVVMQLFWKNGQRVTAKIRVSTGILISNRAILTAAHNVYLRQLRSVASQIDESQGYGLDIALILLEKVEQIPKVIIYQSVPLNLYIAGFPDNSTLQKRGCLVQKDQGLMTIPTNLQIQRALFKKITNHLIYYNKAKTVVGMSGGPIFMKGKKDFYLIGIHVQYSQYQQTGRGVILDDYVWKMLVDWGSSARVDLEQSCLVLDHKKRIEYQNELQNVQEEQIQQASLSFGQESQELEEIRKQQEAFSLINKNTGDGSLSTASSSILEDGIKKVKDFIDDAKASIQSLSNLIYRLQQQLETKIISSIKSKSSEFTSWIKAMQSELKQKSSTLSERIYKFSEELNTTICLNIQKSFLNKMEDKEQPPAQKNKEEQNFNLNQGQKQQELQKSRIEDQQNEQNTIKQHGDVPSNTQNELFNEYYDQIASQYIPGYQKATPESKKVDDE